MRRLFVVILCLLAFGCRSGPEARLAGTWRVAADTIRSPQIATNLDQRVEWQKAKQQLVRVLLVVTSDTLELQAFGRTTKTGWSLSGSVLQPEKAAGWPKLSMSPDGSKIHAIIAGERGDLEFDFVRAR